MKAYRTTYKTTDVNPNGTLRAASKWDGSASDASKTRTALKAQNKQSSPSTEVVEIPVVKQGLLSFLNTQTV